MITEPAFPALWLYDHAPIRRLSVFELPPTKKPDGVKVSIQGPIDGAALFIDWDYLAPIVDLAVKPTSVLSLRDEVAAHVWEWLHFIEAEAESGNLQVYWEFEEKLSAGLESHALRRMRPRSVIVDGKRMFPYIELPSKRPGSPPRRHYLRSFVDLMPNTGTTTPTNPA